MRRAGRWLQAQGKLERQEGEQEQLGRGTPDWGLSSHGRSVLNSRGYVEVAARGCGRRIT